MGQPGLLSYSASDRIFLVTGWVCMVLLCLMAANHPFFWDNVLNARIATHYWEQGFTTLIPPDGLDAGHTPGFNLYLAFSFWLYGRHLPVAHLAMLPFLLLAVFHYWRLVVRLVPEASRWVAIAFFLCDPSFISQATQVSPDLMLLCCALMALDALVSQRRGLLMAALVGMAFSSFRGVLLLPGILLVDVLLQPRPLLSLRRIWPYLPVAALLLLWWGFHYAQTGWLVSPPDETYGTHREAAGIMGMARNVAIMAWRILDQGRVLVVLLVAALLVMGFRRKAEPAHPFRPALLIACVPLLTWGIFFIPVTNPIGHRYWMLTYAGLALLAGWLMGSLKPWLRTLLGSLGVLALLSGHFWLYPDPIAKGWDSTLLHHNWFAVQEQMDDHLRTKGITTGICTEFPNLVNHGHSRLAPTTDYPQQWLPYQENKEKGCDWVVQGNVMNGFEQEDLDRLAQQYRLEQEFRSGPVFLRLYSKKP